MNRQKIILLVAFCICLLVVRMLDTQNTSFVFLSWNLFLAWLPYWLISNFHKARTKFEAAALFLLVVLFLPNAPYIITDLFHLKKSQVAPLWMDVLLILSFALTGLIFFLLTVKEMLAIIGKYFGSSWRLKIIFKLAIMYLSAYGVYLGRYLRFNSWDILTNPMDLCCNMCNSLFNIGQVKETLAMTLTFSVFLFIIYEIYESQQLQNEPVFEKPDQGL